MLQDPALLFFNRSSRATRLYKESEYELACENYGLALEVRCLDCTNSLWLAVCARCALSLEEAPRLRAFCRRCNV